MERNDLLTRYDRRYQSGNSRNFEVDHSFATPGAEPVTLTEIKAWCRVSPSNTADDTVLTLIGQAAREALEKYTHLGLITRIVTVQFNNPCGSYELPWGPVTSAVADIAFTDRDGNSITDVVIRGLDFPRIERPCDVYITAVYAGGYPELPADLKTAILDQADFMYENRGSDIDTSAICQKALVTAQRWARNPVIS